MSIKTVLAPMAGFTDMPFRLLCSKMGADFTVTEMISAAAVCYNDSKTYELARISPIETRCAVQIFGHDKSQMTYAAEKLTEFYKKENTPIFAIEVNMGCPVKKIVSNGDGSALMKSPKIAADIVRSLKDVCTRKNLPLWVKIRAGWDENSINAPYFSALLAENGADRITVHGRTRAQMYGPSSDNGVINAVRKALPSHVELVGNGDIACAADAIRMVAETECDCVAVGRAALGNPWIFKEIMSLDVNFTYSEPTIDERIDTALELTKAVITLKGEYTGIRESRGRAAHFIRGIRGSASIRDSLNHAETYAEFSEILMKLKTL